MRIFYFIPHAHTLLTIAALPSLGPEPLGIMCVRRAGYRKTTDESNLRPVATCEPVPLPESAMPEAVFWALCAGTPAICIAFLLYCCLQRWVLACYLYAVRTEPAPTALTCPCLPVLVRSHDMFILYKIREGMQFERQSASMPCGRTLNPTSTTICRSVESVLLICILIWYSPLASKPYVYTYP